VEPNYGRGYFYGPLIGTTGLCTCSKASYCEEGGHNA